MRAAAAQVAVEGLPHLGIGGLRIAVEQRLGAHDDPGDAVAALRGLLLDERVLQGMQPPGGAQALDGDDRLAHHGGNRNVARLDRRALDQHGAGPALAGPQPKRAPFSWRSLRST